jgi:exodeoxyribonuclease-3
MPRVEEWLSYAQPDILCMQETKLADAAFPGLAFAGLGYESAHHGEGRWNGVAILSRLGMEKVQYGMAESIEGQADEARIVTAFCGPVQVSSVYVPNGRSVGSDHYEFKLKWLAALRRHLDATSDPSGYVAVCGDFNVAPTDQDLYDPAKFVGATHVSPEERTALAEVMEFGLEDSFRRVYPDVSRLFTWWDYRAGDFHSGRGMRIDLALMSHPLADKVSYALVDRNARKGKLPSDHAPMLIDVDIDIDT